jgi:hypothetical protein
MAFWIVWCIDAVIAFGWFCYVIYVVSAAVPQQPGTPGHPLMQLGISVAAMAAVVFGSLALRNAGYRWIALGLVVLPAVAALLIAAFAAYLALNPRLLR